MRTKTFFSNLLFASLLLGCQTESKDPTPAETEVVQKAEIKDEDVARTRGLMHEFLEQLLKMRPFLGSEEKFKSAEGKKQISEALDVLVKRTEAEATPVLESAPGFRINYRLISDHMRNTKKIFDQGEFEYARNRLQATPQLCIQCHSQLPQPHGAGPGFGGAFEKLAFENAEFLFVVREYDKSLRQYDDLIRNFPKSSLRADQIPQALRRKMALLVRVHRDRGAAIQNLQADLKNKNLPMDAVRDIEAWIGYMKKSPFFKPDFESLSDEALLKVLKENLKLKVSRSIAPSDVEAAGFLRVSGLLYERMAANPEGPYAAEWLYYLALCEKNLKPVFWYSMADVYLKECVVKYPRRDITQKCYQAYSESMTSRYSSPERIPTHIKESIEALKSYL